MKKSELKEMIKLAMSEDMGQSEFATNKPGRVGDFIKALDDLIEEFHAELYLNDELFAAIDAVKMAAKQEMGRSEETGDIPGFEGTRDALSNLGLEEAEEEDIEVDTEEDVTLDEPEEDTADVEADTDVEMTGDTKEVQDNLEAALEAAKAMGDQKLVDQIGNSITFFTRTHVVGKKVEEAEMDVEAEVDLDESIDRMKKLAGL